MLFIRTVDLSVLEDVYQFYSSLKDIQLETWVNNAGFAANMTGILLIFILVFLTAFFMAGLAYGISLILPNEVIYETVMNAIVLPVFFLSTALFPADGINGALKIAININPFTHVINALRDLILYGTIKTSNVVFAIMLFILMGTVSFIWALYGLKKELNL